MDSKNDAVKKILDNWTTSMVTKLNMIRASSDCQQACIP